MVKQKYTAILKSTAKAWIVLMLAAFVFQACMEKQEYPIVPSLEYSGFAKIVHPDGYDTAGILLLSYTDGDGDLGLLPFDTTDYNFFVAYYRMENGVLKPGTRYNNETGQYDTINFNNRFNQLAPDDYTGWIKGDIEDTIQPLFDPRSSKTIDTVQFRIHIVDRAGHSSDTAVTPLIMVRNPQ